MIALSKPYRRALALAVVAGLILFLFAVVVQPWLNEAEEHRTAIKGLTTELQSDAAAVARVPGLKANYAALTSNTGTIKRLFEGETASVASVGLQTATRSILSKSKAEVISVEALPPAAQESLQRIGARVVFRGDEGILRAVLHEVNSAVPLLYVERLTINAAPTSSRTPAAGHLTVTLEVFGYWRGGT